MYEGLLISVGQNGTTLVFVLAEFIPPVMMCVCLAFTAWILSLLGAKNQESRSFWLFALAATIGLFWGYLENRNETGIGGILPALLAFATVTVNYLSKNFIDYSAAISERRNQLAAIAGISSFIVSARYFVVLTN